MVSTISVFHCTLMFINHARLFHDFQNVEWFAQRWMICNYNVECMLTTLNDLYYVEWFVLTCRLVQYFALATLNVFWIYWKICTVIEWFGGFNETSFRRISPWRLPRNFLSQQWTLSHEKIPLVDTPPVIIALQQMKKQIFKIEKILKIFKILRRTSQNNCL